MGRNKLEKFNDLRNFRCVFQYPMQVLRTSNLQYPVNWQTEVFKNTNPIVLELGCGYGEYTMGLAQKFPNKNFIGVDIKGARLWHGAKFVQENNIPNVAFLRTQIELLPRFFKQGEIAQIWITFPDPQMKKSTKRLISPRFFSLYNNILVPNGDIQVKTDSNFLYCYAIELLKINNIPLLENYDDLYHSFSEPTDGIVKSIQTNYEKQWLDRGIPIKYLHWQHTHLNQYSEPDIEIEQDTYKSYGRGKVSDNR